MGVVSGVMVRHCTNIPETRRGSGKSGMKGARNVKTINSKNYDNWETIFSCLTMGPFCQILNSLAYAIEMV